MSAWIAASIVIAFGAITGWHALGSTLPGAPSPAVVAADLVAGASFAVVGAVLWGRWRNEGIGALAIAVGVALFLPDMRWFEGSVTWTLGSMLNDSHLVLLAWVVLAFPDGHLDRVERRYVIALSGYFVILAVAGHLFEEPIPGCDVCPTSFSLVRADPPLNDLIWSIGQLVNLVGIGLLVALILRARRSSTEAGRRALSPVVWALWPIALALVAAFSEPLIGFGAAGARAVLMGERLALTAFPLALAAGVVRTRLDRGRVGELAVALASAPTSEVLEERIGDALGDPGARLVFVREHGSGWIDARGREAMAPSGDGASLITSSDGEPLGAMVHDPAVDEWLVSSVAAAATLAVRNERLRAELRRRVIEVEDSRERIAAAAMEERRRIERDLHDGAQQGLLALGATLGSIRAQADGEVGDRLGVAIEELKETIQDLRDLARGVHPAILTDRGLAPAVRALAERAPVPVEVDVTPDRFPAPVEAAAYFFVAEALTNAIRHAEASSVALRGTRTEGFLEMEVSDDGRGGIDAPGGSGLQGLRDRVEALGGTLEIRSEPGSGTRLKVRLPCE